MSLLRCRASQSSPCVLDYRSFIGKQLAVCFKTSMGISFALIFTSLRCYLTYVSQVNLNDVKIRVRNIMPNQKNNYHHGDLRLALVSEACKIIEKHDIAAVSLRRIAMNIGVSQAAPYHHFKHKAALLDAVVSQGFKQFIQLMSSHSKNAKDPIDKLNKLGVAYVEFAIQNRQIFLLMFGGQLPSTEVSQDLRQGQQNSRDILMNAVEDCLPEASELEVKRAFVAAWSLVHGMATLCNNKSLDPFINLEDTQQSIRETIQQLELSKALKS